MKAVLDACVLYPPVVRDILLGVAGGGLFTPVWSARILEEWARATRKLGPGAEAQARAEIARIRTLFPKAEVPVPEGIAARLHLPDPDDVHVLAAAIGAGADAIITFNRADFPLGTLAAEGMARRDPDGFLWELWSHAPRIVADAIGLVHDQAERMSGTARPLRPFLKRAGLPRLAKAMVTAG